MIVADNVPALPDDIDPNERIVTFYKAECRTCGHTGPAVRDDDRKVTASWDSEHFDATGHNKFYLWSVTRQTAEILSFPMRKRGRK
ncbi:hypothetical protein ACZ90_00420 [Streptomyces albus subsp. albus]|nr:hypothetical protein ACZ90_00420 [Streptomyces albus subsp. albus]